MININKRNVIDVEDWDELVQETYGKIYSFQQQEGCQERGIHTIYVSTDEIEDHMHDSIPEKVNGPMMGVKFNVWLERDPKEKLKDEKDQYDWVINMFWERNFYPDINIIANDLCRRGLIEAGEYDIKIDW